MRKQFLFFVVLLLTISILTHLNWFIPKTILVFGDWLYWPKESINGLFSWGSWINQLDGFGQHNIQIYFNIFMFWWAILIKWLPIDFALKLSLFVPLAILSFLSPFILSKKLVKDNLVAFVAALFYGSTTYILFSETSHVPIAFVYSIAPLTLTFFLRAFEKNKLFDWIIVSFVYSLSIAYELRMGLILTVLILIYFIFFNKANIHKYLKNGFIFSFFVLGFSAFWLLPTLFGGAGGSVGELTGRNLFGNNLFDLNHAFTIFHWSWTGIYPNQLFELQKINFYFWIIPLVCLIPLTKKNYINKNISFFLCLVILGIFLTKQSYNPFPFLYEFLYKHVPGFNLFREASKFYIITSIGYLGLMSYGLVFLKDKLLSSWLYKLLIIVLISISLFNLKPLFTKEIGGVFLSRSIPEGKINLNHYLEKQTGYFRTLSAPTYSRWIYYAQNKPRLAFVYLVTNKWENLSNPRVTNDPKKNLGDVMGSVVLNPYFHNILNISSIRYLIIPANSKDDVDDFFKYYGKPRSYYEQIFDKENFLKKISINSTEIIYENKKYFPHVYLTNNLLSYRNVQNIQPVSSKQIDPTFYRISVPVNNRNYFINFSESYNSNWHIYSKDFKWYKLLLGKEKPLELKHFQNDAGLNSFEMESNLNNGNLVLFYKDQAYFYLGTVVSGLFLCLFFIFISLIYGKKIIKQ